MGRNTGQVKSMTEQDRRGLRGHQNSDGSEWRTSTNTTTKGDVQSRAPGQDGVQLYDYDVAGRLLRVTTRPADGEDRLVESYEYSAAGRKTKTFYVDVAAQRSGTAYLWGVEGTDSCYSAPGAATLRIVSITREKVSRSESRLRYEHDSHGNWVMKTVAGRGGTNRVSRRNA
jgi:hypothetical protein